MKILSSSKIMDGILLKCSPFFILLVSADQASKFWAVQNLKEYEYVNVGFALTYNKGALWGLLLPQWLIFVLSALVIVGLVTLTLENKNWRSPPQLIAMTLICAGAVGNGIDRIRLGAVVDFIKIYFWPIFNLADVFLVLAVFIMAWDVFVSEHGIQDA